MRLFALTLVAALVCGAFGPGVLHADEEKDPDAPAKEASAWDAERFWFASLLSPGEAWEKLSDAVRQAPRRERRGLQVRWAKDYVDAILAVGGDPELEDLSVLFRFYVVAERYEHASRAMKNLLAAGGEEQEQQDEAVRGLAQLLTNPGAREALGEDTVADLASIVEKYLEERTGEDAADIRAGLRLSLSRHLSSDGNDDAAIRHLMLMALEEPGSAAMAGRTILRTLQSATHDLDGYKAVRAGAAAAVPVLQHLAEKHLEALKASDAPNPSKLRSAERGVQMLEGMTKPIKMLGVGAPDWTAVHAYGDIEKIGDLKGKVVVLDFWATWCPWCIKSFPAIRDLLRDYQDKGLIVVGITAPASTVYAQRYDLDDDLQDRMKDGERPKPAARMARGEPNPEAEIPLLAEEQYREVEKETIAQFIQNHEMTWPVVMIDPDEPSSKFALAGWPHAVVLDREGRVRYFKSGALLRDRPEAVAAFRKVLEDLLSEKPETSEGEK